LGAGGGGGRGHAFSRDTSSTGAAGILLRANAFNARLCLKTRRQRDFEGFLSGSRRRSKAILRNMACVGNEEPDKKHRKIATTSFQTEPGIVRANIPDSWPL